MVPQDRWVLFVPFFYSLTNFSLLTFLTFFTLSIALMNSSLFHFRFSWLPFHSHFPWIIFTFKFLVFSYCFHLHFLWIFSLPLSRVFFFAIFHHSRSFSLSHTISFFHTSGCFDLFWHDDTIVQGGPRFSPMHSPVRYRRFSPISPLRYISYLHSVTYCITSQVNLAQSLASLNQSMKRPPRTTQCCWPSH